MANELGKVTEEMKRRLEDRRQLFVSSVMMCADADEHMLKISGWLTRGKEAWLKSIVASYRKDVHVILGD